MARGRNEAERFQSLRSNTDQEAAVSVTDLHNRAQLLHEKVVKQYYHEQGLMGQLHRLHPPEYKTVSQELLDELILDPIQSDEYDNLRAILREYGKTEPVDQEILTMDDYEISLGAHWARKQKWPILQCLTAWREAAKYLPEPKLRYKLEKEHCDPELHPQRAGWPVNNLQELIALTILQRGNMEGNDPTGWNMPMQTLRFNLKGAAQMCHLQDLGEKEVVYVRDHKLYTPRPPTEVDHGYLVIQSGAVIDIYYDHFQPLKAHPQLPDRSRLSRHQAIRMLPALETIQTTALRL